MWLAVLFLLAQDSQTSSVDLTLHYPSGQVTATMAREMLDALDEEYARIRHELGCVIGAKIETIVIPFDTWQAMGHAPWSGGMFDGRIQVPLVYERSRVGPKMREVFAHELVHACIARTGNHPTWLHEGLAQHLSGVRLSMDVKRALKQGLREGKLPPLERMSGYWGGMSGAQASTAYAYSLWAVETWIEASGMENVRQALRNPGNMAQIAAQVDAHLKN